MKDRRDQMPRVVLPTPRNGDYYSLDELSEIGQVCRWQTPKPAFVKVAIDSRHLIVRIAEGDKRAGTGQVVHPNWDPLWGTVVRYATRRWPPPIVVPPNAEETD